MSIAPNHNIAVPARIRKTLASAFHHATGASVFALAAAAAFATSTSSASAEDALGKAFEDGKFILDARLRYEAVSHDAYLENASGLTLRARVGYETGTYKGLKLLVEGDFTTDLLVDDFNSTVNGKTLFPVIADPNSVRLNRAQVVYTGIQDTTFIGGRQRIKLDNDRFVGNVGWRQNEQTYDAVLFSNKSIDDLTLNYAYVWQVNRIFGSKSPGGKLDTKTHVLNGTYAGLDFAKITGYAYMIDIPTAAALSSRTFGVRMAGSQKVGDGLKFSYVAEYATQSDYQSNPGDYSVDYVAFSAGLGWSNVTAKFSWEQLGGNGTASFKTPLATLHAFQGFADMFLGTPGTGLSDIYGQLSYTVKDVPSVGDIKLSAWYHDFSSDVGSFDEGSEIDFVASIKPWKGVSLAVKYAGYNGTATRPDVSKLWLSAGYKF